MPAPPTPAQVIDQSPFEARFNEVIPVVRIPVAGPPPFNTLAIVRSRLWGLLVGTGAIRRVHIDNFPTGLTVRRFDPDRPEQHFVQHSTAVGITALQLSDDNTFTVALDSVDASSTFERDGTWLLSFDGAAQLDVGLLSSDFLQFSLEAISHVLFFEAPAPDEATAPRTALRGWARLMVDNTRFYATVPGADVLRAAQELAPVVGQLSAAGFSVDAQMTQQAAVDVLDAFAPESADVPGTLLARAETRHNLIARMLDNSATDVVPPVAAAALRDYRAYAATAGADLVRLTRDLGELVKPLLAAHLPREALIAQQTQLAVLQADNAPADPSGHQLAIAEAQHNVVARLLDDGQPAAAALVVTDVITAYLHYAHQPGADRVRVRADLEQLSNLLASAGLTDEAGKVAHALAALAADT